MSSGFKAIIVGGGPVGLTAALALERAGIDFIMLERRPGVVIDAGSNLVLLPMGLRALSQLGLYEALNAVSSPLSRIERMDHEGRDLGDMQWFHFDLEHFGNFPRVISRHDLTDVLFKGLSPASHAKIIPNKKVANIASTQDGVLVTCADGTSYNGSFVIGTDGAHSMVRELMRTLALGSNSPNVNEEKPFLTTYRALWIRFPSSISSDLEPGKTCETHGSGAASQLFTGVGTGVVAIYERLAEPTKERARHTQADQDAFVERWGHLPLTPGGKLTLGKAYAEKQHSGLVSLEEGTVEHWSWDSRVVLAGDSAHKFTPSTGAGCNNGIIDVVTLANELHKLSQDFQASSSTDMTPALRQTLIDQAFQTYQSKRSKTVSISCQTSSVMTALATWKSWTHQFLDRRVFPFQAVQRLASNMGAANVAKSPVFDFIPGEEKFSGNMPWTKPMQAIKSA